MPRVLREADVVVSMPKLKTHHWVGVTLSLKNCFGCMPGSVYGWPKNVFHCAGSRSRSSTSTRRCARRSRSSTASSAWRATGRSWATRSPRASCLSRDLVAADVTAARLMGMDPEKVEYLMEAGRFLGQSRSELIEQRGEDPESLARSFRPAPGFEHLVA